MSDTKHTPAPCAATLRRPPGRMYWGRAGDPCPNKGAYEEDGLHWCGTHAPSKVKARREARDDVWRQDRHKLRMEAKAKRLRSDALADLTDDEVAALPDAKTIRAWLAGEERCHECTGGKIRLFGEEAFDCDACNGTGRAT